MKSMYNVEDHPSNMYAQLGSEVTTLMVICSDWTGTSNYHTITTTTAPNILRHCIDIEYISKCFQIKSFLWNHLLQLHVSFSIIELKQFTTYNVVQVTQMVDFNLTVDIVCVYFWFY
jgi:hypothetical protein